MKRNNRKLSRVLTFVLAILIVGQSAFIAPVQAAPAKKESLGAKVEKLRSKTIGVGKVQKNKENFEIGDSSVPSYNCMNLSYVVVSDLRQIGANISWDGATGKTVIYDLNQPKNPNPVFHTLPKDALGYLGRDAVYINHQEVPAIFVSGKALIPAKWIPSLLLGDNAMPIKEVQVLETEDDVKEIEDFNIEGFDIEDFDIKAIEDVNTEETEYVDTEEVEEYIDTEEFEEIESDLIETTKKEIKGINIWFNGKDYIEEPYNFSNLKQGEFGYYQDKKYHDNTEYLYVGFVISEVDGVPNPNGGLHKAWLKYAPYYTIPKVISPEVITALFPDTRVKGIMRYAAGGFAKGETVSVKQASSNSAYYLWNSKGQVIKVPWASVSIQKSPVTKEQATTAQIEQYINSKDFSSKTNYFVWTDIYRQRTYVFQGSKNNWKLIKNFLSSTGKDTHLTPVGQYTLNVRVPSFGGSKYRAKNAYGFIGTTYLYHSALYDPTGSYLLSGWGTLGNKASSGCIRLAPENSVWFYKTLPIGTGIFIN